MALDAAEVRRRLLERFHIRVEEEMSQYVLRHLPAQGSPPPPSAGAIPVMGGDSRTGVPLRRMVDLQRLLED